MIDKQGPKSCIKLMPADQLSDQQQTLAGMRGILGAQTRLIDLCLHRLKKIPSSQMVSYLMNSVGTVFLAFSIMAGRSMNPLIIPNVSTSAGFFPILFWGGLLLLMCPPIVPAFCRKETAS